MHGINLSLPNDMDFEDMSTKSTSFRVWSTGLLCSLNCNSSFTLPVVLQPAQRKVNKYQYPCGNIQIENN